MKLQSSNNEFQVQIRSFCEIAIFSRVSRGREGQNKHITFHKSEKSPPPISAAGLLGPDLVATAATAVQ